jgi:hypothetical protein
MATEQEEKVQQMASELTTQADTLREELMEIERNFNTKKEQFLRIQGALEALGLLGADTQIPTVPAAEPKAGS